MCVCMLVWSSAWGSKLFGLINVLEVFYGLQNCKALHAMKARFSTVIHCAFRMSLSVPLHTGKLHVSNSPSNLPLWTLLSPLVWNLMTVTWSFFPPLSWFTNLAFRWLLWWDVSMSCLDVFEPLNVLQGRRIKHKTLIEYDLRASCAYVVQEFAFLTKTQLYHLLTIEAKFGSNKTRTAYASEQVKHQSVLQPSSQNLVWTYTFELREWH